MPSLRFTGAELYTITARPLASGLSFFWVAAWTSTRSEPASQIRNVPLNVIAAASTAYDSAGACGGALAYSAFNGSAEINYIDNGGLNDGYAHLCGWTHTTGGNIDGYIGAAHQTTYTGATYNTSNNGYSQVGRGFASQDGCIGDIGAVITLNGIISSSDLTSLNAWAQQRWGVHTSSFPTITSLNYNLGDIAGGGNSIIITGTNLSNTTSITVGGNNVVITANTSTLLTFTLPSHSAGAVTISVTTPFGTTTTPFTYWSPAQIANIDVYFDSNKGTTTQFGGVGTWLDQSTNAVSFTQSTQTNKPVQTLNVFGSMASLRFTPQQWVSGSRRVLSSGQSYLWIGAWTSSRTTETGYVGNAPLTIIGDDTSGVNNTIGAHAGLISFNQNSSGWTEYTRGSGLNDGNARLLAWILSASNNLDGYVGASHQSTTIASVTGGSSNGYDVIGDGYNDLDGWQGDIGAVIICNGVISTSDLANLDAWSVQRYSTIAAPTITSLNYIQGDGYSSGQPIIVTGTDLLGTTIVTIGGNSATILYTTETTVSFTLPSHAAGAVTVSVTTPQGTSNTLPFTYWSPQNDASVTLFVKGPNYAVSAGTGTWTATVGSNVTGSTNVPNVSTEPSAPGTPAFTSYNNPAAGAAYLTGPLTTGLCSASAGTIMAVAKPYVNNADFFTASYQNAQLANFGSPIGLWTSADAGLTTFGAHLYDGNGILFKAVHQNYTQGQYCAVLARWSTSVIEISVDGSIPAGGGSTPTIAGVSGIGTNLLIGQQYNQAQFWSGNMRALIIANTTWNNSQLAQFYAWSQQMYGTGTTPAADPTFIQFMQLLQLEGYWKASYTGSPWTATATAGGSGANGTLSQGTNPATTGTAVNSFVPAAFNGTNQFLTSTNNATTYMTTAQFSGFALVFVNSITANSGGGAFSDDTIIGTQTSSSSTGDGYFAINVNANGPTARIWVNNTTQGNVSVSATLATSAWQLIQWKFDNTNIKIRVNAGAWQSVSAPHTVANLAFKLDVGRNDKQTIFSNMSVLEIGISQYLFVDATFDSIRSYINLTYGLSV